MKAIKGPLLIVPTLLLVGILGQVGLPFAMLLMTFAMGLAIAGPARWITWSLVFIGASAALIGAASHLQPHLPRDSVVIGAIAFGLLPLTPAFYLWLAHLVRRRNPR